MHLEVSDFLREEKRMLDNLFLLTTLSFVLCLAGIGIFTLPVVALMWLLYFGSSLSLGGGIAVAGICIGLGLAVGLRNGKKKG